MKLKFPTRSDDPADDFKILEFKATDRPDPVGTATVVFVPDGRVFKKVDLHQNASSQWAMPAGTMLRDWDGVAALDGRGRVHYRFAGFATPEDKARFFRGVWGALARDCPEAFR